MLSLSHKNLLVYQVSIKMVKSIYQLTKTFPKEEMFVLTSQIRRAAISVSSNIAEGAARVSKKEKRRFYDISRSSLVEVDTQLEIGRALEYYKEEEVRPLKDCIETIFKLLSKMIVNINKTLNPTH
jgi:four helix bundle protein